MRSSRHLACGATLLASLLMVSPASAANWDPPGTELTATSTNFTLTDDLGNAIRCPTVDTKLTATGDLATTTAGVANPVAVSAGCTSSLGANTAFLTTFGTWQLTATSTTTVDLLAIGTGALGTGPVLEITAQTCTATIDGPVRIHSNAWNAATHTLTLNRLPTFASTSSNPGCFGIFGSVGSLEGTVQLPASVAIT